MTYGRERRGVIQKRFGESFLDGKEGNRGKNTEQGFAAVIVFVPRERVDFLDTLKRRTVIGRAVLVIYRRLFQVVISILLQIGRIIEQTDVAVHIAADPRNFAFAGVLPNLIWLFILTRTARNGYASAGAFIILRHPDIVSRQLCHIQLVVQP